MIDWKNKIRRIKKAHLCVVGVILLILLAAGLLWSKNSASLQSDSAFIAQVYFDGEYRVADGEWQKLVEGEHISSTKGDVTLRGNFHMRTPDGEYVGVYRGDIPIAFYSNHISLTICEAGFPPAPIDMEDPRYGYSVCGERWTAYTLMSAENDTVEIVIHNPHIYGNENAIDEMLSGIALWDGMSFEKEALASGQAQRSSGIVLMLISGVFLGIALFSSLIHIKKDKIIWLIGLVILFAGVYVAFSAGGVSFWNESIVANTTILGVSMMFYMLFVSMIIVYLLKVTKKVGSITVLVLAATNAITFFLPLLTKVFFYDTWIWWIAVQLLVNAVLAVCLIREFFASNAKARWFYIGAILPLISFGVDVFGTWRGIWQGGRISQYVLTALLAVATVMVLKLIPDNINAAAKAKELEMEKIVLNAELAESRISTMMSQIRPHFIYNTLGSIEQLCELDPKKAGELVHDFAKYLRGNFGELDNPKPIPMSQEMAHVHHYVSIENVRFPDMTFSFDMNSEDFNIPALTVQPIVENAIKHGLMKLQKGGSIRVVSFETESDYRVCVEDDGVGFDTSLLLDERKHVGLRNIRERLKAMVGGTIEIESTVGVGTKVLIIIPKEAKK